MGKYMFYVYFAGRRADIVMEHTDGIKGFQAVLQQINKLMNYPSILQAQTELGDVAYCFFLFFFYALQFYLFHSLYKKKYTTQTLYLYMQKLYKGGRGGGVLNRPTRKLFQMNPIHLIWFSPRY